MIKRGSGGANFIVCPGHKIFWLRLCATEYFSVNLKKKLRNIYKLLKLIIEI